MDVALLRTFLAIYRHGTVTRAARALHLSQPAVSQQLRALEAQAGRPLFVRLPRGLAPTAAGHELAHDVGPPLDALEAVAEAHRGGGALGGTLLLGGPADLLSARVLPALAPLVEQGLRVRARTGLAQPLLDEAERDELDLVVATVRGVRKAVELEPLFDETFVLVAGARWAARIDRGALASAGAAALAGVPLVAYAEDLPIIRRYYREVFAVRPRAPARLVIDDLRGVLASVVAGAGVSVLPRYLVDEPLRKGELTALHEPRRAPRNTIYLGAKPAALRQPRVAAARTLLLRAAPLWLLALALAAGCRTRPPVVPSEEMRIQRVEDGLLPAIVVEGRAGTGRPIEERMAAHGVEAAGVAVIDAGRVVWARGYGQGVDAGTRFPDSGGAERSPTELAREVLDRGLAVHLQGRVAVEYDPASHQGAVVMTRGGDGLPLADEVVRAVAAEYGWPDGPRPLVKKALAVDPAALDEYAGRYRAGSQVIVVARDGDRLTLSTQDGRGAELYPESPDRFFMLDRDASVSFERGPDGKIAALVAHVRDRDVRAVRL